MSQAITHKYSNKIFDNKTFNEKVSRMQTSSPLKLNESEENFAVSPMKVGIAIPTYNEKGNLQPLIERLLRVFQSNEISGRIVIVDDKKHRWDRRACR